MDTALAIAVVQETVASTSSAKLRAWQHLLNIGIIWHLQDAQGRSCGRHAAYLLCLGVLHDNDRRLQIAAE